MAQNQFQYKNDYAAFLALNPSPQKVVDFIVYVSNLPSPTLQDIEAVLEACHQVKHQKTTIRKLGYWYDSQFIVYESMFWNYRHAVFESSYDSFVKAVEVGLESFQILGSYNADGIRMARRVQLMLRYPQEYGYPENFKDQIKADEIKLKLEADHNYDQHQTFQNFVKFDLKEAESYVEKGTRDYYYIRLYLHKDKEALQYFQKQWKNANPAKSISLGLNYLHALQNFDKKAAKQFQKELQEIIKVKGDAEGFTHWARMNLRKYSPINDFSVIPWVIAGRDEPSKDDIESCLRHCEQGLNKIAAMENIGAYQYRNTVFLYETKAWVLAHLAEKTYENYCESLRNYKEALSLYVNVDNYNQQLQFALGRYIQNTKETLSLFNIPGALGFDPQFATFEKTKSIYKEFVQLVESGKPTFPYTQKLKLVFQIAQKMDSIDTLGDSTFEQRKEQINDSIMDEAQSKEADQARKSIQLAIEQLRSQAAQLKAILDDSKMKSYYQGFIKTFAESYKASIKVLQGRLKDELQSQIPISFTTFLNTILPIIGSQTSFNDFLPLLTTEDTRLRANNISKLSPNSTKLDSMIQSLAIKLIIHFKNDILQISGQSIRNSDKHLPCVKSMSQKAQASQNKLFNNKNQLETYQMELGTKHAVVLLENMVANGNITKMKQATPIMKIEALQCYVLENKTQFQEVGPKQKKTQQQPKETTDAPPIKTTEISPQTRKKVDEGCACLIY